MNLLSLWWYCGGIIITKRLVCFICFLTRAQAGVSNPISVLWSCTHGESLSIRKIVISSSFALVSRTKLICETPGKVSHSRGQGSPALALVPHPFKPLCHFQVPALTQCEDNAAALSQPETQEKVVSSLDPYQGITRTTTKKCYFVSFCVFFFLKWVGDISLPHQGTFPRKAEAACFLLDD